MELDVQVSDHGHRAVVSVAGEIDASTTATLQRALDEVIPARSTSVVVDLSGVDFLDSTGLGVLVNGLTSTGDHGGSFELVVSNHRVRRIFELGSLTELFPMHESLAEAIDAA